MKVLHLSDTTLSGSPYRISKLLSRYSKDIESRHLVWQSVIYDRVFPCDLVGERMYVDELRHWLNWADVLHFHNRWQRQTIFKHVAFPKGKKKKKMVIQIHSPRKPGDIEKGFAEEVDSRVPIAVIAQYHVRQWPERSFVVPNVVDIFDELHMPIQRPARIVPTIAYAPSSPNGTGWDNKSYSVVHPVLKRLSLQQRWGYQRITGKPFHECLQLKQKADIGIDEISTGSYHLASLEFLSMGVATIGRLDNPTERVVKDITGCSWLPWIQMTETSFKNDIQNLARSPAQYLEAGKRAREWMETFWKPEDLVGHYRRMYEAL